ncbi:MAG: nicotinamide-nucleotide amidohydrolase family protein [bacterium]
MNSNDIVKNIEEIIGRLLLEKKLTISIAESCTGGLVSSRLTDISGSSAYIKLNLVTYSNESKIEMLKVPEEILTTYGAVSEQTAAAMAEGAKKLFIADIGVGITGIAGPTGATLTKPIGLVYIGISNGEKTEVLKINANPLWKRRKIKFFASEEALEFLKLFIEKNY